MADSMEIEQSLKNAAAAGKEDFESQTRDSTPCRVGRSVGRSVGPSVRHIFEFRAVFALLLLPNRPRLDCRVSGLV